MVLTAVLTESGNCWSGGERNELGEDDEDNDNMEESILDNVLGSLWNALNGERMEGEKERERTRVKEDKE